MDNVIKDTIYPNLKFDICVEEQNIGHLTYRLSAVKRWYPAPSIITHYTTSLMFGDANRDMIVLQLPDIKSLDELIEFLMELKMKWDIAEKALNKEETSNAKFK